MKAANNKNVDVWYGIPYAQPPVGDLRFRRPQPMTSWNDIKETTEKPNSCVQVIDDFFEGFLGTEMWNANTEMSEDCLYLNVAVPQPHPQNAAVMVWIHGGGFTSGTSTLDIYDIRTLASEQNVIVVSMQYRLAALGFLFFGNDDAPGNAGLYDQHMAMQWVQDNIAEFGGDPEKVTIFGSYAGAVSVGLHLLSPLSTNLFNQAIMQSGSALVNWGTISREESLGRGMQLAKELNCPSDESQLNRVIECLRTKDASILVSKNWATVPDGAYHLTFLPVVDGVFLRETPEESMKANNFKNAKILTGISKDEGNYFLFRLVPEIFKKKENVLINRKQFKDAIKLLHSTFNEVELEAIMYEYTDWSKPNSLIQNRIGLDRMIGDQYMSCPTLEFSDYYGDAGNDVFTYSFNHHPSNSPWPTWSGALYGDEILFIFGVPLNRSTNYNEDEIALSKRMMSLWANFAKTGDPSLSEDGKQTACWPKHSSSGRAMLQLTATTSGDDEKVTYDQKVRKCAFFKYYLPRLHSLTKGL